MPYFTAVFRTMNTISLKLRIIPKNEIFSIEGIDFSGVSFIEIFIDGEDILKNDQFFGSFIYWGQLEKTVSNAGKYLIFTSVSGIADDAGWDYVSVQHSAISVVWKFKIDEKDFTYSFDRNNYFDEIKGIEKKIKELGPDLVLEPVNVLFPEE